jgi:hypothetical protein
MLLPAPSFFGGTQSDTFEKHNSVVKNKLIAFLKKVSTVILHVISEERITQEKRGLRTRLSPCFAPRVAPPSLQEKEYSLV